MRIEDAASHPVHNPQSDSPGFLLQADSAADASVLADAWNLLKRRRYWLLVTLAVFSIGAVVLAKLLPQQFDAYSTIRINSSNNSNLQLGDNPVSMLSGENEQTRLQTEIAVLQSESLALSVANVLDLYRNPTFSKPGKKEGTPSAQNPASVNRILHAMDKALTVDAIPHTEAIRVTVRTRSPQLSEQITNTLIDQYVERGYQVRYESQKGISEWLSQQLGDLRKQTEDAQSRALEYGKKLNLYNSMVLAPAPSSNGAGASGTGAPQSLDIQALFGLQQALTSAQSDRMVKEAQYHALQTADLNSLQPGSDPALANLLAVRASAIAQYDQNAAKFGPNSSEQKGLKAQIASLDKQIQEVLGSARKRAALDLNIATQTEQSLQKGVDDEKHRLQQRDDDVIRFTIAQRDFESAYSLYRGLLEKLKEAGVLAGLRANDIEIVDRALVPLDKSAPRTSIYLLIGLGAGLISGAMLAVLVDSLDQSILSSEMLEQRVGIPMLGAIPKERDTKSSLLAGLSKADGEDPATRRQTEAFWSLRTSILMSHAGTPPRKVIVTSSIPAEGKTTISLNLSAILAQDKHRVILIECDLRRPTIKYRLPLPGQAGLSQVLSGMCPVAEVIQHVPGVPNMDVILAGAIPPNPSALLGSDQFAALLRELESRYQFIVLDTPPAASISDVRLIARLADGILFVVRAGYTPRQIAEQSCRMLRRSGAVLLGGILNMIDYRSGAYGYYYGYDGYYTNKT